LSWVGEAFFQAALSLAALRRFLLTHFTRNEYVNVQVTAQLDFSTRLPADSAVACIRLKHARYNSTSQYHLK
jgi:hypothetical protein